MYSIRELSREEMIELLGLMDKKYGGGKVYAGYDSKVYKKLKEYLEGRDEKGIEYIVDIVYDYELRKLKGFFEQYRFELVMMRYLILYFESYVVGEYLASEGWSRVDYERVLKMCSREEFREGKHESRVEKWKLWWWVWRVRGKRASS